MNRKCFRQWLRVTAALIIAAAVALSSSASYASYGTCSQFGLVEHQCSCLGSIKVICSAGEVWNPASYECTSLNCGGTTCASLGYTENQCFCSGTQKMICSAGAVRAAGSGECTGLSCTIPKHYGKSKLEENGYKKGTTPETGDPIPAAGGEFRHTWNLLSLDGVIPFNFNLIYASDLSTQTPASDGLLQFSAVNTVNVFNTTAVMRLMEFTDKSLTPNTDYINILMAEELLVFKYDSASGKFVHQGPEKYQIEKNAASGNYYLMSPSGELVYIFRSRPLNYEMVSQSYTLKRVGEVEYIRDRSGNRLTFTYNSNYLPTKIEDNTGRYIILTYNSNGYLASASDYCNRSVYFVYQTLTCNGTAILTLTDFKDTLSKTTSFVYDDLCLFIQKIDNPLGNSHIDQEWTLNTKNIPAIYSQKDAYGNTISLNYAQNQTAVTYPDGKQRVFLHEANRYPTGGTDQSGKSFDFDLTADKQMSKITDRMGAVTQMSYHSSGKLASVTNAKNQTMNFTYTAAAQTITHPSGSESVSFTFWQNTRIDYPDGTNEQFAYDAYGNLISHTDQTGNVRSYQYNAKGQMTRSTNPTGGYTDYAYNADGTLASVTDSELSATTYTYDSCKRVSKVTHPDGSFIQTAYNPGNQIVSITDENNKMTSAMYNDNGGLFQTARNTHVKHYYYDLMDRVNRFTDGEISITYAYDSMGRLASVTEPGNVKTDYAYDPRGWLNTVTQNGDSWKIAYDDEGIPTSFTTPMNRVTRHESDTLGYLSKITDPLGNTATFTRDAMNRITAFTDPLNRTISYDYDDAGSLSSVTLPLVGKAEYTRNDAGIINQIKDLNGSLWNFTHSNQGRLLTQTDPLGNQKQYAYNSRGMLNKVTYPGGSTQDIVYDPAGNITQRSFSGGPALQFAYDYFNDLISANNLTLTRNLNGRVTKTDDGGIYFSATHNNDKIIQAFYNNGAFFVYYFYDQNTGLLKSVSCSSPSVYYTFTYDADRQLTGITRSNGVNSAFSYDNAGRLIRIQEGTIIDAKYTLDATGQVIETDMTAPLDPYTLISAGIENFAYDAASQVSTAGYSFDSRGRETAFPGTSFVWDGASRLTKIGNTSLTYNGLGDLLTRNDGTKNIRYYYNYAIGLAPIVAEKDESTGQFLRFYAWTPGGQLLFMIDAANGNKVYHYHFDRTGSTLALTDSSKTVTDRYAYDPYGRLLKHEGANPQPFTFVGKYGVRQESPTLYQMRARYYDATTGHFLSREPLWPQIGSPKELNPYQYALNNPISFVDPTGKFNMAAVEKALQMRLDAEKAERKNAELAKQKQMERDWEDEIRRLLGNKEISRKGFLWIKQRIETIKHALIVKLAGRRQAERRNLMEVHLRRAEEFLERNQGEEIEEMSPEVLAAFSELVTSGDGQKTDFAEAGEIVRASQSTVEEIAVREWYYGQRKR